MSANGDMPSLTKAELMELIFLVKVEHDKMLIEMPEHAPAQMDLYKKLVRMAQLTDPE